MNCATLSIGSNSADRNAQMRQCLKWLKCTFDVVACSSLYCSPAVNGRDPEYINAVATINTQLQHDELKAKVKQYERSCGRTDLSKMQGSIPIDIDIVIWNGSVVRPKDYSQQYFIQGWQEIKED